MFSPWAKTYYKLKLSSFVGGLKGEVLHDKDNILVHCDAPQPHPLHIHCHLSVSAKKNLYPPKKMVSGEKNQFRQKKGILQKNLHPPKRTSVKVYHCILHRWVSVCHPTWVLTANQRSSFHLLLSGYF